MQHESAGGRGPARVLLVGEDPRAATMIVEMLRDAWPSGLLVTQTAAVADAQHELADHGDSGVLLDLSGAGDDLDPLRALVAAAPEAAIVVVSDRDDESLGVAAVNAGAQDHLLRSELRPALLTRALRYALERKRAEVRLAQQALEDPLTGLPNRTLFLDRVGVALDRSRRTGLAPAVMFLDVDSFKGVNDSLGHAAGDRLLRTLSQRFQALLRPMDTVARLGGDEFVFLFEGVSGHEEATAIARRIGEAASEPVALGAGPSETSVGASVGFAMLDDPAMAPEDALGNADTAMYRAKALGGGRAEMFDDGPTDDDGGRVRGAARLALADADPDADPQLDSGPDALVADDELVAAGAGPSTITRPRTAPARWEEQTLRDAVHAGRLRVHYQPRVSIDGRTGLVGFEALVRLDDPERGLVVPAEFMAAAQDSDLIVEIDDVVLDEALRQVRRWRQSRPGVTVSVNISPRQLADPELPERLRARLRETDTDPSVLWLEIPDSAIRRDPELAAIAFARLSEIGVALAIDDYRGDHGADHLRDLPVEMLKIDPAVVARLENPSARDEELLETIVELGHELGLSVVAEGVETDHQLAWIRDLRCDGAQGYLFSRPVPEESVHELLGVG